MILRDILLKVGGFQSRHYRRIILVAFIFTCFMLISVPQIKLQTNLNKELPSGIPVINKMKEVSAKFGISDSLIVLIKLNPNSDFSNRVIDIRDPRIIRMVGEIDRGLEKEPEITHVYSFFPIYSKIGIPQNLEQSRKLLNLVPELSQFYSRDYTTTAIYIYSDIGSNNARNRALVKRVREIANNAEKPPGVEVMITGEPLMRVTLFKLLIHDAILTMSIAAAIILALLILIQKSLRKGIIVFIPLTLSIIWLFGTMGLLNIPLSIGTVAVGAMILGLGVEYGIFMFKRYEEEKRKSRTPEEILMVIVPTVGLNITGSASTTITGFLALLLATMPMIQSMGLTLALGIFYSYIAAVAVNPPIMLLFNRRGWL